MFGVLFGCKENKPLPAGTVPLEIIAIPVNKGWGYEIYVDNKLFIRQNNIPAVNGLQHFTSKEQALKAAGIAVAKMKAGRKPIISVDDLQQAGIEIMN